MASTNTPSPSGRGRNGRGRGRGRGRGSGQHQNGRGGQGGNGQKPRKKAEKSDVNTNTDANSNNNTNNNSTMTDQQVLISFGPFVRSGNAEAVAIHQNYLKSHNQAVFLGEARQFLLRQEEVQNTEQMIDEVDKTEEIQVFGDRSGEDKAENSNLPAVEANKNEGTAQAVEQMVNSTNNLTINEPAKASNSNKIKGPPPGILPPPGLNPIQNTQHQTVPQAEPSILPAPVKPPEPTTAGETTTTTTTQTTTKTKTRRTQTRLNEQPGKLFANGISAQPNNSSSSNSLTIPLRSELSARWILPLKYLRERVLRRQAAAEAGDSNSVEATQNLTIRDALTTLTIGLFRHGIPDNGCHCSIVSKSILADAAAGNDKGAASDYPFDIDSSTDSIYGTVPFYSPRTPGNVVFRMYFENEAYVTLATGPVIKVIPEEYGVVLRFILGNFKKKGGNGMGLLSSFAGVLESFTVGSQGHLNAHGHYNAGHANQNNPGLEEAGRAAWGCICESRKLVDAAALSYNTKKEELDELEKELEEADRVKQDLLDMSKDVVVKKEVGGDDDGKDEKEGVSEEKNKLMTERYTNERRWKEIQLAYAMLIEIIILNDSSRYLFKKELMHRIRCEYELWCPLSESFAPNPFSQDQPPNSFLVQTLSKNWPSKSFEESRKSMQLNTLGFIPIKDTVASLTAVNSNRNSKHAHNILRDFSKAMKTLYDDEYFVTEDVYIRREAVRSGIEKVVAESGAFPEGTRVAIFGSSANGFGSPNSDLDLCLQVPQSATDFTKENGVTAMTTLAEKFTSAGMHNVDTVRLTARIPIVKFDFPYKQNGQDILVECDLSLQNPLACLNTSLLNAYSRISQESCILASIIKRWAKMRDINNPSKHTLSSYGYVLMLLYYLTSSEPTKDGLVLDPGKSKGSNPILVNLQRVDPTWAQNPTGPYREMASKPHNQYCIHQHPTEPNYSVNTYFYRNGLNNLGDYHKNKNTPSLGVLLASFFRYFAYDFDYKKHVVSLDTKHTEFKEKEEKAEQDGWSLYKPGLAIEDPFEHFYDVAHVVKTSNFHHIQKEFALAYSKIARVCREGGVTGRELVDLICEPVGEGD